MNLSPHFTLEELTHSDIAVRRGIDNTPPPAVLQNMKLILAPGLERVRALIGMPLHSLSGYRSFAVNRAVGGSSISAHCEGVADDFIAPMFGTPQEVARKIRDSDVPFDQLIFEGTWVHISFSQQLRRQVLTAHFNGGPATYTEGIA